LSNVIISGQEFNGLLRFFLVVKKEDKPAWVTAERVQGGPLNKDLTV